MTDRPILFSAPMVRALLAGQKTQTRRLAKWRDVEPGLDLHFSGLRPEKLRTNGTPDGEWRLMSRGAGECWQERAKLTTPWPGDRLWVRETCVIAPPRWTSTPANPRGPNAQEVGYLADNGDAMWEAARDYKLKKSPAIHMPRWASRLTLTVTDVRVQRLQDISEADAVDEGAMTLKAPIGGWWSPTEAALLEAIRKPEQVDNPPTRIRFAYLWNCLNEKPGRRWADNPWTVALTFTVEQRNIDATAREAAA